MRRAFTVAAAFSLASAGVAANAATITVANSPASANFHTIQDAIDAANNGDVIVVADGTYTASRDSNLLVTGKHVTIQSANGAASTILDNSGASASNLKHAIRFSGSGANGSALVGFTIKNSFDDNGGAVQIIDSSASVTQCVFLNNTAAAEGGAIDVVTNNGITGATIAQCSFLGNTAGDQTANSGFGGAIGCVVNTNTGLQQNVSITNCTFDHNIASYDGGAIDVEGYSSTSPKVSIVNSSFVHNNALGFVAPDESGILSPPSGGSQPGVVDIFGGVATLTNSILYGDTAQREISTLSPGVTATYSDVQQSGVSGSNNINTDPQYADVSHMDPTQNNLHLLVNSPAINVGLAGNQTNSLGGIVPTIDLEGRSRDSLTDLGAYEFQAPLANAQTVSAIENTAKSITLTGTDLNSPARPLTYSVTGGPSHGALSGTAPNLTYTPGAGYSGSDSFTFTVNNGRYTSAAATVTINVTAVNQQPTINAISNLTINANIGVQTVNLTGISQGAGDSGQTITITATSDNTSLIPTPVITYTSANSTGTLTYASAASATGVANITVKVQDNGGTANGGVDTKTITFKITVNAVVLAPTANNQSVTTNEETATGVTLTGSDPNQPAKPLTYSVTTSPAHGTLSGTAPNLTYTPNSGYFGADSFQFTVNNGTVTSSSATVSITVNRVNKIPTIASISDQNVAENSGAHSVNLSAISPGTGDSDQTVTITATSDNTALIPNPTISYSNPNSTGTLSFTPAANTFGSATITVTVQDNGGTANGGVDTKTITFKINVSEVVLAPTANSQSVTTSENNPVSVTLTGSDPNVPAKPLTYTVTTSPTHGTLSGTAPNLTYTPNAGYFGSDSFQFTVNNGTQTSNTATVSISISEVVQAPTANSQSVSVNENTGINITLTGSDPNTPAKPLTYSITSGPSHGTFVGTAPNLTYKGNPNYFGPDSFTFTVNNGTLTSNTATVSINVSEVVQAPTANSQSVSTNEGTAVGVTLTGSDPNVPAKPLTYTVTANPAHGTLSGTAPNLTYTPNAGYFGSDSFQFTVNNGTQTSIPATVSISISEVVQAPTANSQSVSVNENTGINITLTGSDPNTPAKPLTYSITSGPSHGTFVGTAPNLTYKGNPNYFGPDSFTFTVNNGTKTSNTATVSINVSEVVQAPTANSQSVSTAQDTAVGVTLTGSDPNTPAKSLTYSVTGGPSHGTLSGTAPNLTYTPNAGYYGADSFTFTVNNGTHTSNTATVSFNISQAAATNVTGQITVTRGGYVYSRANGHYRQSVTLTNTGAAVAGPISLVLDNLTNATLTNATGVTSAASPAGSPYINAAGLGAGASTTILLDFNNQPGGYTPRILAGGGAR